MHFTKLQFLEKISSLVHFVYSFSKACFFDISYLHFLKDLSKIKSLSISKCSCLLQTNKLMILLQKHGGKAGNALSVATNYKFRDTHHLYVEAIFICDWLRPTQPSDLIFLTSSLLMATIVIT